MSGRAFGARRRLRGHWLRWSRWEYWPAWALYLPVVPVLGWRSRRHGGPRVATCANPAIPLGGLVGESKSRILETLSPTGLLPKWGVVAPGDLASRRAAVAAFRAGLEPDWPVVLKPDRGERGVGVTIARDPEDVDRALRAIEIPVIAQEYVPGPEYGVFWSRRPGSATGEIFSVAAKRPVSVTGDGRRTVDELFLAHDRILPLLSLHRRVHAARLAEVLPQGEQLIVTELGTHCLGATFEDAAHLRTPALVRALDRAMAPVAGLDFGRFDLRVPSEAALRAGRDLRVLEFNGLSAESASLYDPDRALIEAWRGLVSQWSLALEIGDARRRRGGRPARWGEIARAWWAHRADQSRRGGAVSSAGTT